MSARAEAETQVCSACLSPVPISEGSDSCTICSQWCVRPVLTGWFDWRQLKIFCHGILLAAVKGPQAHYLQFAGVQERGRRISNDLLEGCLQGTWKVFRAETLVVQAVEEHLFSSQRRGWEQYTCRTETERTSIQLQGLSIHQEA